MADVRPQKRPDIALRRYGLTAEVDERRLGRPAAKSVNSFYNSCGACTRQ